MFFSFCINEAQTQNSKSDLIKRLIEKEEENVMSKTYLKLWNSELRSQIDRNIEKNRKGGATIEVVDRDGNPVKNVLINIQQKTHSFLFGCNAFVLGQLESPEENEQYEKLFTRIFNFATVPIYWGATEPQQGKLRYKEGGADIWRRPPVNRFIPFAKKYDLTLKAHPLLWHEHNPAWLPQDADSLKLLYQKRFRELSARYTNDIPIWEVTNESSGCPKSYPLFSEDRAYVEWAFNEAASLFGNKNLLMINDYTKFNEIPSSENVYYQQIQRLLDKGVRVQGIGFQFHIWFEPDLMKKYLAGERYLPEKMLEVYDEFAKFNLPLYITEITVPTPDGDDGEIIQAEVVKNLYRLWFSVPSMAGITYWNLGDIMAYDKENSAVSGLVDKDMNPKPSYLVLDELINKEWNTHLNMKTNDEGEISFRGFYGKYTITVSKDDTQQSFDLELSQSKLNEYRLVVE